MATNAGRTAGLLVPKPSRRTRYRHCGASDLGTTVRWRPPLAATIVTHLVTQQLTSAWMLDGWAVR